jgi:hypothetical protein
LGTPGISDLIDALISERDSRSARYNMPNVYFQEFSSHFRFCIFDTKIRKYEKLTDDGKFVAADDFAQGALALAEGLLFLILILQFI